MNEIIYLLLNVAWTIGGLRHRSLMFWWINIERFAKHIWCVLEPWWWSEQDQQQWQRIVLNIKNVNESDEETLKYSAAAKGNGLKSERSKWWCKNFSYSLLRINLVPHLQFRKPKCIWGVHRKIINNGGKSTTATTTTTIIQEDVDVYGDVFRWDWERVELLSEERNNSQIIRSICLHLSVLDQPHSVSFSRASKIQ